MKRNGRRILFPQTYKTILKARAEGLSAVRVWSTIKESVERIPRDRVSDAAMLATYHEYICEIYKIEPKELPV